MAYIENNSISVGFNPTNGQGFFDILKKKADFIHDYFFSVTESYYGDKYNPDDIIDIMKNVSTYHIPANLLLNADQSARRVSDIAMIDDFINRLKDHINLQALTVRDLNLLEVLSTRYPEYEMHLSVRFWDWDNASIEQLITYLTTKNLYKKIDVINVSLYRTFNDVKLMEWFHDKGIKIKITVNEKCIVNRHNNFRELEGFDDANCKLRSCSAYPRMCDTVIETYPWMQLATVDFFKEQMQYYPIDIINIASRNSSNSDVESWLQYWTSNDDTNTINECEIRDYDAFLTFCYIKSRECKGMCAKCMKCKDLYDSIMKEV